MKKLLALLLSLSASAAGATNFFNTLDNALYPTTYGTATYCWTSNGNGVLPTWQACSGGGGGSGTVTSLSVATANGFGGTVATATTTPVITLTTGVTGLMLGNGSAAAAYGGASCTNQFPRSLNASGAATCASVALATDVSGILAAANGGAGATSGVMKANGSGLVSAAVAADIYGLWSGTCSSGTYLRGDGACAAPAGAGDMVLASVQTVTGAKTFGTIGGAVGKFVLAGSTSGSSTLDAAAVAGTTAFVLPSTSDTLVGKATTDTLTNKTFDTAGTGNVFRINGTAISAVSGTGSACLTTSCSMTTPVLGTPTSGTLTNATGLPIATGVSGLGTGIATALAVNTGSVGAPAIVIASGTSALGTSAISSAACATVVTTSATGTATTDVVRAGFNGDPTAVTGYVPSTSGMLTIIAYPTANNVNFKVCNNTGSSITPGAITLNWTVQR